MLGAAGARCALRQGRQLWRRGRGDAGVTLAGSCLRRHRQGGRCLVLTRGAAAPGFPTQVGDGAALLAGAWTGGSQARLLGLKRTHWYLSMLVVNGIKDEGESWKADAAKQGLARRPRLRASAKVASPRAVFKILFELLAPYIVLQLILLTFVTPFL